MCCWISRALTLASGNLDPGAVQVDGKSSVTLKVFGVLNNNFSTEHIRDTLGMAEGSTLNFEIDQSEWDQYKNDDGTYNIRRLC